MCLWVPKILVSSLCSFKTVDNSDYSNNFASRLNGQSAKISSRSVLGICFRIQYRACLNLEIIPTAVRCSFSISKDPSKYSTFYFLPLYIRLPKHCHMLYPRILDRHSSETDVMCFSSCNFSVSHFAEYSRLEIFLYSILNSLRELLYESAIVLDTPSIQLK